MRNFDFDDEESTDREEQEEGLGFIDYEQYDLMQADINQKLLAETVAIAKDTLFWSFMPLNYKLKRINLIYDKLSELIKKGVEDHAN